MNFNQLQAKVQQHLTKAQVKELFGDLRRKETWEAAYASLAETIAATADAAKEIAQEAAETVAILADNSVGLGETLAIVGKAIVAATVAAAYNTLQFLVKAGVFCWFFYLAWHGKDIPQVQGVSVVKAEEDRVRVAIDTLKEAKAAFQAGHQEEFTVPTWVRKTARTSARINKRAVQMLSLIAQPQIAA